MTILSHLNIVTLRSEFTWRKWNWPPSCYVSWTPETAKKRSVSRWACRNRTRTNSLCSLPDVLVISDMKDIVLGGLLLQSVWYFLIFVPESFVVYADVQHQDTGPGVAILTSSKSSCVSKFIFSRIKKRRKPKVKLVTLQLCEVKKNRSSSCVVPVVYYESMKRNLI